jgi:hypothetical protein
MFPQLEATASNGLRSRVPRFALSSDGIAGVGWQLRRFTTVWNWQRDQAEGEERTWSARWFGGWTGASAPYRGGKDSPPATPGLHSAEADDAYERYVDFLGAGYEPGKLGPPRERRRLGS